MSTTEQALRTFLHDMDRAELAWDMMDTAQKAQRIAQDPLRSWLEVRTLELYREHRDNPAELGRQIALMIDDNIDEL